MLLLKVFVLFIYLNSCFSISLKRPSDEKFTIQHYVHNVTEPETVINLELNDVEGSGQHRADEIPTNLMRSPGVRFRLNDTRVNSSHELHYVIHLPHHSRKNLTTQQDKATLSPVLNSTVMSVFNPNKSVSINATREKSGLDNTLKKTITTPSKGDTREDVADYYNEEDYYDDYYYNYDDDYYYGDEYYQYYGNNNRPANVPNLPNHWNYKHHINPNKKTNVQINLSAKRKPSNSNTNNLSRNKAGHNNNRADSHSPDYYETIRRMLNKLRLNNLRYNFY